MSNLNNEIRRMTLEAFETMCFMFPVFDDETEGGVAVASEWAQQAVVRFDGDVNGGMIIRVCDGLRSALVENMLGFGEDVTEADRDGAVFELANIICGNIVPEVTAGKGVSYIQSPRTATNEEVSGNAFASCTKESVQVTLDEGLCEVIVYYN